MAPIRQIRQHEHRTTLHATAVPCLPKTNGVSLNNRQQAPDAMHSITFDYTHPTDFKVEPSHTILTEEDKMIRIYSKKRNQQAEEDGDNILCGEPAIYSTDGSLCHSLNELYPRKSARLVSSRPIKKAARKAYARVSQPKQVSTLVIFFYILTV